MDKCLVRYEHHERDRIDKQVDGVMKLLVFESGMMKNFDYDIGNVSKQVGEAKAGTDIEQFISSNASQKPKTIPLGFVSLNNLLTSSIQKLVKRQTYSRVEYEVIVGTNQRKKEVKEFIESSYKGTLQEETLPEDIRTPAFLKLA